MGTIEKTVRQRVRRHNLQRAVLSAVAVAGILAWIAVAPNTLQLIKYVSGMRRPLQTRATRARNRLVARGLLKEIYVDKIRSLRLTKKGEIMLARLSAGDARMKKPTRWDEHWRIVIFDIPERRKASRDSLRRMLIAIGFKKLQASVWVYPYDCEDLLTLLKTDFALGKEVLYIVSKDVERDQWLRHAFALTAK